MTLLRDGCGNVSVFGQLQPVQRCGKMTVGDDGDSSSSGGPPAVAAAADAAVSAAAAVAADQAYTNFTLYDRP